ncbi:pyrroline-5-carboxylate reductase [bacterium]|nr:MAG: pyrroline-5-carboxylate reductase [bacterium]
MPMKTLAFLGPGAMAKAIAGGLLRAGTYAPDDIVLVGTNVERVQKLADSMGVRASTSAVEALQKASTIVVAVKPQIVEKALAPLRDVISSAQTVISVAAGISTTRLESYFSNDVPVVRVMPNTPSMVGAGASAICGGKHAGPEQIAVAREMFEALGMAVEVDEKLFDAVTGLSGSGPAYVFIFIEALADGAVRAGLPRELALKLAAQTVLGSAQLLLETGDHPGLLKDKVASPGGTTIAAIHALESGGFRGTVMDAVLASAARSRELS